MSSRSAIKPHVTHRKDLVAIPVSARATDRVEAAANDDDAAKFSFRGDPLLGMAIGTVVLFVTLAALVAFV